MSNELIGIFALLGSNLAMFFWLRTESNADRREFYSIANDIKNDLKDFHGRMCMLEEKYIQMMERMIKEKL